MNELVSYFGPKHIPPDIQDNRTIHYMTFDSPPYESFAKDILEIPSRALPDNLLYGAGLLLYPGRHPEKFHDLEELSSNGVRTVFFESDTPWNRTVANYLIKAVSSFLTGNLTTFINVHSRAEIKPEMNNSRFSFGILGAGTIGSRFAKLSRKLFPNSSIYYLSRRERQELNSIGAEKRNIYDIMRNSDFVIASLPYIPDTPHLIGYDELIQMKSGAFFVNVSNAGTVKDADVSRVLTERPDLTAVIDTSQNEEDGWVNSAYYPYVIQGQLPGLYITMHTAYKSPTSTRELVYAITRPLLLPDRETISGRLNVNVLNNEGYNDPYILKII